MIDAAFFGANFIKVAQGGWFPLVLRFVFTIFTDDVEARPPHSGERIHRQPPTPLEEFLKRIPRSVARVRRPALFNHEARASRTPPAPAAQSPAQQGAALHLCDLRLTGCKSLSGSARGLAERVEVQFGHGGITVNEGAHYGSTGNIWIPATRSRWCHSSTATATHCTVRVDSPSVPRSGWAWRCGAKRLFALCAARPRRAFWNSARSRC